MKIIIGIDDTDNLESRGTGHLARQLALSLHRKHGVEILDIVRHQLYVHELIPFTSHNSSASINCVIKDDLWKVIDYCRAFLLSESAVGSDVGLCISRYSEITAEVIEWGRSAKVEILTKDNAHNLADKSDIFLEGLTGEKIGVIGSLAAVGLRAFGNDGRVLWLPDLRETTGTLNLEDLKKKLAIECVETMDGQLLSGDAEILLTDWTRPIVKHNKITLIVQKSNQHENQYIVASKDYIKSLTE